MKKNIELNSGELFFLVFPTSLFWGVFFFVGLLRRLFYCMSIITNSESIHIYEKGIIMRRDKIWYDEPMFEIIDIRTLGYLPRIRDHAGFEFGQLLGEKQKMKIIEIRKGVRPEWHGIKPDIAEKTWTGSRSE